MSDTPRTDAAEYESQDEPVAKLGAVDVDFARQLERELNALDASALRLGTASRQLLEMACEQKERIKRLEEAGDAVAAIIGPPGSAHWADENQVDAAWNNWTKAKEAK